MATAKEHIGQRIKRLRSYRGMTQDDLAAALGKTRSLVSFLERTGKVNKYTLQEVAQILNVTPEDLEAGDSFRVTEASTASSTPQKTELVEQLRKEIGFLKETINHQWDLLKALSKSK